MYVWLAKGFDVSPCNCVPTDQVIGIFSTFQASKKHIEELYPNGEWYMYERTQCYRAPCNWNGMLCTFYGTVDQYHVEGSKFG